MAADKFSGRSGRIIATFASRNLIVFVGAKENEELTADTHRQTQTFLGRHSNLSEIIKGIRLLDLNEGNGENRKHMQLYPVWVDNIIADDFP